MLYFNTNVGATLIKAPPPTPLAMSQTAQDVSRSGCLLQPRFHQRPVLFRRESQKRCFLR